MYRNAETRASHAHELMQRSPSRSPASETLQMTLPGDTCEGRAHGETRRGRMHTSIYISCANVVAPARCWTRCHPGAAHRTDELVQAGKMASFR